MPTHNFDAVPDELKQYKQWILWKYEDVGAKKPTKVPYSRNGTTASVTEPNDWCTFTDAIYAYRNGNYSGIGFVFTDYDPFAFVDLDDTEGNQTDLQRQIRILKEFDSYAEVSPSGQGLHIIVKGKIPQGRKRSHIEIYSSGRYATMTGKVYEQKLIADRHDLLNQLFTQMGGQSPQTYVYSGDDKETEDDKTIIERALNASNGDKFNRLLSGDWNVDYPSQSEADLAFVDIIGFYTQNRVQIARIFRSSSLGSRAKAQRKDYVDWMINKSFDKLLPKIDFDGFRIALEEKLAAQQAQLSLPLDAGVSPSGKATAFDAVSGGSNPSTPANASVAQRLEPSAHNGLVVGSNPAASTITPPPGLMGELAQFIYQASPRPVPEIAIAGAVGLMAGICGRAYNVSGTGLNQYVLLLAPTGCHAKGTQILMCDGTLKNVEDVEVGDLLMGPDSWPRKVLNLARGRETMIKIKPTKGEEFVVNENHILSLVHTETRERINLTVKEWIGTSKWFKHCYKLERKPVEFSKKSLPLDPWFLGAMLGDGCFGPSIQLTSQDNEVLNKALAVIKSLDGKANVTQVEGNKAFQHRYSKAEFGWQESRLQRIIKDLGLWLARSHDKFIPHIYKTSSFADRMSILAGILDTDGSLTCNGYDFISKSKRLANDVCFIARSLGLAAYIKSCEKYSQNNTGGTYYRVSISGDCFELPLVLEYKKAKPRKQKKDVLVTGFTHEVLSEDDFYGFALNGDHLYLTGDFTVHHNTGKEAIASGIDRIINHVQLSVPVANEFIGPSEIASGQALIKYLAHNQSIVSLLGEFGLRLRSMSSDRANGAEIALRRMLLDLYNKSGHGKTVRPSIYADKDKNIADISAPAFSILGESTPDRFYDILTEEMISEGLLPRFMLIEYNGERPAFNKSAEHLQPPLYLIEKVATLMANAKTVMANRKVINVGYTPDAEVMLDGIDKHADKQINSSDKEVTRQLWNRAHIKCLKISALIAVGCNPLNPMIETDHVLWAKNIVEHDIRQLSRKFESGEVGKSSEEVKQINDMKKAMKLYVSQSWDKVAKSCDNQMMHAEKIIPHSYLGKRLYSMASYRNDKVGQNAALKRTIQVLLDSGYIAEIPKKYMSDKFGSIAKGYQITNMSLIDLD